jgi:hypothetical protein
MYANPQNQCAVKHSRSAIRYGGPDFADVLLKRGRQVTAKRVSLVGLCSLCRLSADQTLDELKTIRALSPKESK